MWRGDAVDRVTLASQRRLLWQLCERHLTQQRAPPAKLRPTNEANACRLRLC